MARSWISGRTTKNMTTAGAIAPADHHRSESEPRLMMPWTAVMTPITAATPVSAHADVDAEHGGQMVHGHGVVDVLGHGQRDDRAEEQHDQAGEPVEQKPAARSVPTGT